MIAWPRPRAAARWAAVSPSPTAARPALPPIWTEAGARTRPSGAPPGYALSEEHPCSHLHLYIHLLRSLAAQRTLATRAVDAQDFAGESQVIVWTPVEGSRDRVTVFAPEGAERLGTLAGMEHVHPYRGLPGAFFAGEHDVTRVEFGVEHQYGRD